jgi:hypothetical protein
MFKKSLCQSEVEIKASEQSLSRPRQLFLHCSNIVHPWAYALAPYRQISNQVYLGDIQIPKIQRRPVARSLAEYESESDSRDSAIRITYASGAFSYQDIGSYFG